MTEPRIAYFVMETEVDEHGNYIPRIATEGEPGYHRTNWQWGNTFETANKICDQKNAMKGITPAEAGLIQLSIKRKVPTSESIFQADKSPVRDRRPGAG